MLSRLELVTPRRVAPESTPNEHPIQASGKVSQKRTFLRLKEQIPEETYETRLKDTVLLQVTDMVARIAVPSAFAVAWLERRMDREISQALRNVLHYDVDLQFVATS